MMNMHPLLQIPRQPAIARLSALAPLDGPALAALEEAVRRTQRFRPRQEIVSEGEAVSSVRLVLSGWGARLRLFPDGRRQLLSFVLPGDLIGLCDQPEPLAVSTVIALTELWLCQAPAAGALPALARAETVSRALEEAYLLAQITRLGRLTAQERIVDFLLELLERLQLAGLADANGFDLPVTQEMLGDALGLTAVHVNRMLQLSRSDGDLVWRTGRVTITDPAKLARAVGHVTARVSTKLAA